MKGIFGGILGLFNVIGGIFLSILIGSVAFNQDGRIFRILFGSLTVGLVVYGIYYLINKDGNLFIFLSVSVLFAFFLEWLRYNIEFSR